MATFLASDEARFITGETVKVDGGLLAQGVALWGTGSDNTFMKSAGVNRGTTGEAMVVRTSATGRTEEMTSEAERLHGHLIGQQGSRGSLNSPSLVLDLDMLDRNIAEMANFAKAHNVKLRPHSKTHKSADIAKRQIAAGALGVCCAKLGEAEALGEAGVQSLHITSPVVTPQAIQRLVELNAKVSDLMLVVDHPDNAEALASPPPRPASRSP